MKFVWYLTGTDWDKRESLDDYIGCCRIGDLCFDILVRTDEDKSWISYDCYVGGVDDGYGYGQNNYPYTYGDGGDWDSLLPDVDLNKFIALASVEFTDFIEHKSLTDKANEPLHIW